MLSRAVTVRVVVRVDKIVLMHVRVLMRVRVLMAVFVPVTVLLGGRDAPRRALSPPPPDP